MITVLTPTYNRAHTLRPLYDSLCNQSSQSFEWLVVDDGSEDGTDEFIQQLQSDGAPFDIRFISQKNSGKHVAVNNGVQAARGGWVFIVDSDDCLTPDAMYVAESAIASLLNENLVGVCFRKSFFDGRAIGVTTRFCDDILTMHPSEAGNVLKGDLAYLFTRESMLGIPFPVVEGEKFVPELYVWNKIGDLGEIRYFANKAIYLADYLPDGYSRNFSNNLRKNCRGFQIYYKAQFFREESLVGKLKCVVRVLQCEWYAFQRALK